MPETTTKEEVNIGSIPFSLDDLMKIEFHHIPIDREDLVYCAQYPQTFNRLRQKLEAHEEKWVLKLPKLYCLSVGESSEINALTIRNTRDTINYQNLVRKISSESGIEPMLIMSMLAEPWLYAEKVPALYRYKDETVEILANMQASTLDQAQVTIVLKTRKIVDWTGIDTQRLSQPLLDRIRSYIIQETRAWKEQEAFLSEEDQKLLESMKSQPSLQLGAGEQKVLAESGDDIWVEEQNPIQALNPSPAQSVDLREDSTTTIAVQASQKSG